MFLNPFGVAWSEKCSREAHRPRMRRRNFKTVIKEELNGMNIVFIRTCRKPRSNYPANPVKSPRRFYPPALRAYLAKTFEKTRNPRVGLCRSLFKFNCANHVNLTERKRAREKSREIERDRERRADMRRIVRER